MKCKSMIAMAALSGLAVAVPAHAEQDFEEMCRDVSVTDGLPPAAIDAFCPCLAETAAADQEVEAELRASIATGDDPDTRLAGLSEIAADAVLACQAAG